MNKSFSAVTATLLLITASNASAAIRFGGEPAKTLFEHLVGGHVAEANANGIAYRTGLGVVCQYDSNDLSEKYAGVDPDHYDVKRYLCAQSFDRNGKASPAPNQLQ